MLNKMKVGRPWKLACLPCQSVLLLAIFFTMAEKRQCFCCLCHLQLFFSFSEGKRCSIWQKVWCQCFALLLTWCVPVACMAMDGLTGLRNNISAKKCNAWVLTHVCVIGFSAVEVLLCMTFVWECVFFDLDLYTLCIPFNFKYTDVENENSCVSV